MKKVIFISMIVTIVIINICLFHSTVMAQGTPQINFIPKPQHIEWKGADHYFKIDHTTKIMIKGGGTTDDLFTTGAEMLNETIEKVYGGLTLTSEHLGADFSGKIIITDLASLPDPNLKNEFTNDFNDPAKFGNTGTDYEDENYILDVEAGSIFVVGKRERGAFYGTQTLIQLIQQKEGKYIVGCRIEDYPSMGVRALHMYGGSELTPEFERRIRHFAHLKYTHIILETGGYFDWGDQTRWNLQDSLTNSEKWVYNPNPDTWANIEAAFNYCRQYGIEPIPELQSFGWGHNVLSVDPNCAEAIYVEGQKFIFDDPVSNLARSQIVNTITVDEPGFENYNNLDDLVNNTQWEAYSDAGGTIEIDVSKGHESSHSVLINRTLTGTSKLWQEFDCDPNTVYMAKCWIKIDGTLPEGPAYIEVYGGDNTEVHQQLWKGKTHYTTNDDWQLSEVVFGSESYTRLRLYIRLQDGTGTVRFDDISFSASEYALHNVILTHKSPIRVWNLDHTVQYMENIDYDIHAGNTVWRGKFVANHPNDEPYKIERRSGGNIALNQEVLVDYNLVTRLNDPNVPYCPSEARVYQIMFQVIDETIQRLNPQIVFIGHDEVMQMGTDSRCILRNLNNAQLFASETNFMHSRIAGLHGVQVWMFGDMLDPYLNGYRLKNPTAPAINQISHDIVISPWFYDDNWEGKLHGENSNPPNPFYKGGRLYNFRERTAGAVEYFRQAGFKVLGTPGHHWIRGAYIWAQEQYARNADYGMLNTAWTRVWGYDPAQRGAHRKKYNWNTLVATAQFSWHQPFENTNDLEDAGWFYYDEIIQTNPYYDGNGEVIFGGGTVDFNRFNEKYGDIFVARPTGLRFSDEGSRLMLRWNANNETDVTGYKIYHRLPGNSEFEFLYLTPTNFKQLSNVVVGTEFVVSALDEIVYDNVNYPHRNESRYSDPIVYDGGTGYSEITNLVGDKDNIHSGDPADIPPQSQFVKEIIARIVASTGQNPKATLDEGRNDRPVGLTHYFSIPSQAQISSAHLKFKFKGTHDYVYNDAIKLDSLLYPQVVLKDVLGYEPSNGTLYLVNLDLSHVPVRTNGDPGPGGHWAGGPNEYRNLLAELLDGQLDLVFVDDLILDYSELTIQYVLTSIDNVKPYLHLSGYNPGPPASIEITVQDTKSGLAQINEVTVKNATVNIPSFVFGTTNPIIVTATKIDQNKSSTVVLEAVDVAGNSRVADPIYTTLFTTLPQRFALEQNYPNPFNPTTTIHFDVAASAKSGTLVQLKIFDILGREVKTLINEEIQPGEYSAEWNGTNNLGETVAGGVYIYRLVAGDFTSTKKMILLK